MNRNHPLCSGTNGFMPEKDVPFVLLTLMGGDGIHL